MGRCVLHGYAVRGKIYIRFPTAEDLKGLVLLDPVENADNAMAANLPMRERIICRKATGLPLTAFWASEEQIDLDSIVVLWWMARRMNGEATLTFDQAIADWPDDLDIETELEIYEGEPDDEADDPEA